MTGPRRILPGRGKPLPFTFAGRSFVGQEGDTIASALLANGITTVGHSFKYRRPRGILSAGEDEPNAIVDVVLGGTRLPNVRATMQPLEEGMRVSPVLGRRAALLTRMLAPFIPSGFYYKTFLWPNWHAFEPLIRRMAGLGRLDPTSRVTGGPGGHLAVDLCVVGAGRSGLRAAIAAARAGQRVILVERQAEPGGSALWQGGEAVQPLIDEAEALGIPIWTRSIAFGAYEAGRLGIWRQGPSLAQAGEVWTVTVGEVVLATGALERPLLFQGNDLPGVMLADAALRYLRRHGVLCGDRPVLAVDNDSGYAVAHALAEAGAQVTLVDSRKAGPRAEAAKAAGIQVMTGRRIARAIGRGRVRGVILDDGHSLAADAVLTAGGWTPTLHLYCQSGGKAAWDEARRLLLPAYPVPGVRMVGRAAGDWPAPDALPWDWTGAPHIPAGGRARKVWIDLQNDVTLGDVRLAAAENFTSVEHLKRYTTLGMATDQGKTANLLGAAAMAAATNAGETLPGLTTYRPPYVPVSMAALAGLATGALQSSLRRLQAEPAHRAAGAVLRDYGGHLRPAFYGADEGEAVTAECLAARQGAVVLDASSLGKVAVMGPDAGALVDFLFAGRMSNLSPGRIRYGLTLNEAGIVTDDGVVLCLEPDHFLVSCSSGHAGALIASAEEWRQTRFGRAGVHIHDRTGQWATMALSGPRSKAIMAKLGIVGLLDDVVFPHMSFAMGRFMDQPARVARVSFTGERGYEISVPTNLAAALFEALTDAGARPLGIEALGVLRAEKGFIYVGQDTDGETMPQDLGFTAPREKRVAGYVGDRALQLPVAGDAGRRQLIGLSRPDGGMIPAGAHLIEGSPRRSIGFVTSSHHSPTLGRGIALALLEGGRARIGQDVTWFDLGQTGRATVTAACAYDPEGGRLNV